MNASKLGVAIVVLCVSCGSKFTASATVDNGSGGTSGINGAASLTASNGADGGAVDETGGTGTSDGGAASASAGSGHGGSGHSSGGSGGSGAGGTGGAESGASGIGIIGGSVSAGGSIGTIGTSGSSGSGGMNGSAGASGGSGSSGTNGSAGSTGTSSGGTGSGSNCATLQDTYLADLAKARVCNPSIKTECSASSTLPGPWSSSLGESCSCPALVAAGTASTAKAKLDLKNFNDAGCTVPLCMACPQYSSAACTPDAASSTYMCTGAGTAASP